jgi:hypothetical protein
MKTQPAPMHLYKGVPLKDCPYATLKIYAIELKIDLKSLKKMNENNLIKAINEMLAKEPYVTPFFQLQNVSTTFRVNYAHHFGAPKEVIMERLCITAKSYVDKVWLYENCNYKNKIVEFLNPPKAI